MAGTLYIVGTPIGNLEDVTMRALRVLREVDLIAAEDTRRTARLLQHYSIATATTSLHEHNEHGKAPHLIARLQAGESMALVSDAGMPLVSDPGSLLVRAARAAGIPIQVVPGPSAVTATLAAAGISGPFAFLGFPPAAGKERKAWIAELGQLAYGLPVVFFEAPHRIQKTVRDIAHILGDRPIIVARELTKIHESLVESPIKELVLLHETEDPQRGEHVLIVPKLDLLASDAVPRPSDEELVAEIGRMTENEGLGVKAASKALAAKYGLGASEIYALHARHNK